jgi:hypothetical protein
VQTLTNPKARFHFLWRPSELEPTAAHTRNLNKKVIKSTCHVSPLEFCTQLHPYGSIIGVRSFNKHYTLTRKLKSHYKWLTTQAALLLSSRYEASCWWRNQRTLTPLSISLNRQPSLPPPHINMQRASSDVIFQIIKHQLLHTFSTTDPVFKVLSA